MLPVQTKAYKFFNVALTLSGVALSVVYIGLSQLSGASLAAAIYTIFISSAHLVYMLLVYPLVKRRSLMGASLIGAILFVTNIAIILLATGGLRSPYYALWLLVVLGMGIFRPSVPLGLLALTTLYFVADAFSRQQELVFLTNDLVGLLITYISAALGFWLWHTHHTRLKSEAADSERLNTEQIKSELVLKHIADGVVVVDTNFQVQLINPAGIVLTGWGAEEAIGLDYKLILPLSDEQHQPLTAANDPFQLALSHRQSSLRDDIQMATRSGKRLALSLLVSPIFNDNQQISGLIGVFRDISQAKAVERQRNEFISTASHEMRTPLAAIEGYVALTLNTKVARIDDKARLYLLKAQESTQHLGKLFQDLLATTRIEEGKLPNHPEVVELGGLIGQVIDELALKAQQKGLKLIFHSGNNPGTSRQLQPLFCSYVDPERIREVLINLVDNAIKFTADGEVLVSLNGNAKQIEVGIHDTGMGIAREDIPHLFQKFYRLDYSQTRGIGGTGLGLYISRAIIEMYQGRVWVESKLGEGTHFRFSLPRLEYSKAQAMLNQNRTAAVTTSVASPTGDRVE